MAVLSILVPVPTAVWCNYRKFMRAFAVINCVHCNPVGFGKRQYMTFSMTIQSKSNSWLEMRSCCSEFHRDQETSVVVARQNVVQMLHETDLL